MGIRGHTASFVLALLIGVLQNTVSAFGSGEIRESSGEGSGHEQTKVPTTKGTTITTSTLATTDVSTNPFATTTTGDTITAPTTATRDSSTTVLPLQKEYGEASTNTPLPTLLPCENDGNCGITLPPSTTPILNIDFDNDKSDTEEKDEATGNEKRQHFWKEIKEQQKALNLKQENYYNSMIEKIDSTCSRDKEQGGPEAVNQRLLQLENTMSKLMQTVQNFIATSTDKMGSRNNAEEYSGSWSSHPGKKTSVKNEKSPGKTKESLNTELEKFSEEGSIIVNGSQFIEAEKPKLDMEKNSRSYESISTLGQKLENYENVVVCQTLEKKWKETNAVRKNDFEKFRQDLLNEIKSTISDLESASRKRWEIPEYVAEQSVRTTISPKTTYKMVTDTARPDPEKTNIEINKDDTNVHQGIQYPKVMMCKSCCEEVPLPVFLAQNKDFNSAKQEKSYGDTEEGLSYDVESAKIYNRTSRNDMQTYEDEFDIGVSEDEAEKNTERKEAKWKGFKTHNATEPAMEAPFTNDNVATTTIPVTTIALMGVANSSTTHNSTTTTIASTDVANSSTANNSTTTTIASTDVANSSTTHNSTTTTIASTDVANSSTANNSTTTTIASADVANSSTANNSTTTPFTPLPTAPTRSQDADIETAITRTYSEDNTDAKLPSFSSTGSPVTKQTPVIMNPVIIGHVQTVKDKSDDSEDGQQKSRTLITTIRTNMNASSLFTFISKIYGRITQKNFSTARQVVESDITAETTNTTVLSLASTYNQTSMENSTTAMSYEKPSTPKPTKSRFPQSCAELYTAGRRRSGIYKISPLGRGSWKVYCDMETDGGGWTIIQRRMNGEVNFTRSWQEYARGFGQINGDYWLGLDRMHTLTTNSRLKQRMTLRIDLKDWANTTKYAKYNTFRVGNALKKYKLVLKQYSGTAGNALEYGDSYNHNHQRFTTHDEDNDGYMQGNCGSYYQSGWWFNACFAANLNGRYYRGNYYGIQNGIYWGTWHRLTDMKDNSRYSFQHVDMKVRPVNFAKRARRR